MSDTWLGIDTSTPFLCLALWSPLEGVLAETVERVEREHGARLIGALEECLAQAGLERGSITAIGAGNGPGSYTGLRVGGAAAKGLARALDVPLAGCDTLAAIAFRALRDGEEGLVALDARRGNAYLGRYRREEQEIVTLVGAHKAALQEARSRYPDLALIQDIPPDPGYVASRATSGAPYRPIYL